MIFNQERPPRFLITVEGRTVMSVIIGIDPHKALHAACAIDRTENQLAALNVRSGTRQVSQLLEWASPFACRTWAIEMYSSCRRARPTAPRRTCVNSAALSFGNGWNSVELNCGSGSSNVVRS